MNDSLISEKRVDIFSHVYRAGRRTYFFDVRETKSKEKYISVTESVRRTDDLQGKHHYEKHKIFVYKEDFGAFVEGLKNAIQFIDNDQKEGIEMNTETN